MIETEIIGIFGAMNAGKSSLMNQLQQCYPVVKKEHLFGREWMEPVELKSIKLLILCDGCMITPQRMATRLRDLEKLHIPIITSEFSFTTCLAKMFWNRCFSHGEYNILILYNYFIINAIL